MVDRLETQGQTKSMVRSFYRSMGGLPRGNGEGEGEDAIP
jgi:hypothetical protein